LERIVRAATSESRAATEKYAPVRVAVARKQLVPPPRARVSEEEVALLQYLGRDSIVPSTLDVGSV